MTVYLLNKRLWFPDPREADENGIVALGGDLSWRRLTLAYRIGLFPWFNQGEPIIWWCPDPRFVLFPDRLKVRRSLRKILRKGVYEIRYDTAFTDVVAHCASVERPGQAGTWITGAMKKAYIELHRRGHAHSIEAWRKDRLVGGLYGVGMGPFFFGESMFFLEPDASKAALVALVDRYRRAPFIDCQIHNAFFESMGAGHIPRDHFLETLHARIDEPDLWRSEQRARISTEELSFARLSANSPNVRLL